LQLEYTQLNATFDNVQITDCHFHEIRWFNLSNITVIYGGGNAIRLVNTHSFANSSDPQPVVQGLEVRNNIFHNVDMAFSTRTARCGLPEGYRAGVATKNARIEGANVPSSITFCPLCVGFRQGARGLHIVVEASVCMFFPLFYEFTVPHRCIFHACEVKVSVCKFLPLFKNS
jgi:hypothetical protein